MNPRITGIFIAIIVAAAFITGIAVYPQLPATLISHWSASGEANGHMPRLLGVFLLPGVMLVLYGMWALLPAIDPIAKGFRGFRYVYDFFWILLTAFLAYVYALTLGIHLGWHVNLPSALAPALAALFVALGLMFPRVKRNWFFGIRTPWSLASDEVWDRTQEFGGKLFVIAGILMLVGTFASPAWSLAAIVWPIILAVIPSVLYSYLVFKRERKP